MTDPPETTQPPRGVAGFMWVGWTGDFPGGKTGLSSGRT
jgi:hypothetical protein